MTTETKRRTPAKKPIARKRKPTTKPAKKPATKPATKPAKTPAAAKARTAAPKTTPAPTPPAIATIANDTRTIAVELLDVAPENARAGRKVDDVDGLAANISRYGLLQPLVGYEAGGRFKIVDGRRRLAALRQAGLEFTSVVVRDAADAMDASLAANTHRTAMHPADEATQWSKMVKDGADTTAIANAFGVSEIYVKRRLKLGGLHAPILSALAKDQIGIDTAILYASAPAERQAALWKRLGRNASRWSIKDALKTSAVASTDRLAKIVGEKAYIDAGGRVERDLFAEKGDGENLWIDRALVEKLAGEKLEASAERLRNEGWQFAEVIPELPYHGLPTGFARAPGKPAKSKAAKSKRGCIVSTDYYTGRVTIVRDLVRAGSKEAKEATKAARKTGEAPPPQPMTKKAHETATRVASAVVGLAIADRPDVALAALCAHLARIRFQGAASTNPNWNWSHAFAIEIPDAPSYGADIPEGRVVAIDDAPLIAEECDRREKEWATKIEAAVAWAETGNGSLEQAIAETWDQPTQLAFMAYALAPAVQVIEAQPHSDSHMVDWRRDQRQRLAAIGRLAGADASAWWTPNAAWFKGLSRELLDAAAERLGVTPKPKAKGKLAEACAARASEKNWTPELVNELIGVVAA